jgi:acylphosphatase
MSEPKVLYKIKVTGRVQGVGFRQSCLREARYRGIVGFVKNMPDGSVYIEAEGNMDQLGELINWCKHGPGYGSVEDIIVETGKPVNHNSFIIRY